MQGLSTTVVRSLPQKTQQKVTINPHGGTPHASLGRFGVRRKARGLVPACTNKNPACARSGWNQTLTVSTVIGGVFFGAGQLQLLRPHLGHVVPSGQSFSSLLGSQVSVWQNGMNSESLQPAFSNSAMCSPTHNKQSSLLVERCLAQDDINVLSHNDAGDGGGGAGGAGGTGGGAIPDGARMPAIAEPMLEQCPRKQDPGSWPPNKTTACASAELSTTTTFDHGALTPGSLTDQRSLFVLPQAFANTVELAP